MDAGVTPGTGGEATGGAAGSGPTLPATGGAGPGTDAGAEFDGGGAKSDDGCSCRIEEQGGRGSTGVALFAALGVMAVAVRRMRPYASGSR